MGNGTSKRREILLTSAAVAAALFAAEPARAQAASGGDAQDKPAQQPSASAVDAPPGPVGNEQAIVVTARKRLERLQDVPVPVTVLPAETLTASNQTRLQDYYSRVPGLNLGTGDFRGDAILNIRGITTGGGGLVNPTVGIVVDDVPYGSSTGKGGGGPALDLDPSDLSRIEVLRGPQGTLYGVSSIGGLLKYVTADPDPHHFFGYGQAGIESVAESSDLGYNVRGGANVPLNETLAMRFGGFYKFEPGYVDNLTTGQKDINSAASFGGRASLLWKPVDSVSIKLGALYQDVHAHGASNANPSLGDLKQAQAKNTGWYHKRAQAYSAVVSADLGPVQLTSLTGYSINKSNDAVDYSAILGPFSVPFFGVPTFIFTDAIKTKKFSQELRVSGKLGHIVDWRVGAFYTHENTPYLETDYAEDPVTGAIAGVWLNEDFFPTTYKEKAIFGDLTFHLSDRFDVEAGGRWSHNSQTYLETFEGLAAPIFFGKPSPFTEPMIRTSDSSFTYLFTPRFRVSRDLMVYARLASGYRAGGPNANYALYNLPPTYKPDTTRNYELGAKGQLLGGALAYDLSIYYIDWSDIQLQLTAPVTGANYYANGSKAKSEGVELALSAHPARGLSVEVSGSINNAKLTEALPANGGVYGAKGDRLPISSPFSGNIAVDQSFRLWGNLEGSLGASMTHVGDRKGIFQATPLRQDYPAFTTFDLRGDIHNGSWTLSAYLTNVFDRRGILGGGIGTINPPTFIYIRPRAGGLNIRKTF